MIKNNLNLKNNIFFKRIYSIKKAVISYSFASFLDIFLILNISSIFKKITEFTDYEDLPFYIIQCLIFIIIRTVFVYFLKKYAFNQIFYKKLEDERIIVESFVNSKLKDTENYNLNSFKEKLINSCNLAAINFDIPICAILAELFFALGGLFILLNIFGFKLFLLNIPVVIILLIFSKFLSKKLNKLGDRILITTEERLNSIDNVSELAFELSSLNQFNKLIEYFTKINNPFNKILSEQITTTNMMQIITESGAFIIILISLTFLIISVSQTSLANSATSFAVLSRMVPSFTRTISFLTQLQFGVPCIKRLSKI